MTEYVKAPPEVVEIAKQLIDDHHNELISANIGFLFRDQAAISRGKVVLGKAKKPPTWLEAYQHLDFIIEIAADMWKELSPAQRRALIDHELCHCAYDAVEEKASLRAHDIEEFNEIIDRHGLWQSELLAAAPNISYAFQQEFEAFKKNGKVQGRVITIDPEGLRTPAPEF